ncbi:hypothetical protein C1924_14055 [Stenotrophomonas sp. ESTM1D_MKCIP4_1]|uniref:hypothetical protein n=1 Tax=Stenotrophomonas sp. ESTM1D_MKCIP4_1 TaxID=2072414 RepID=UPI000D542222|nr:hypothetical protein [Stenotrophomonas sp. ESTM1D_MKCIP4_1]AWH54225.1 hypothetical protein C1924_14055 [Stenotrophomonas sp. ESTM1D_MKCIP4_1]
MKRSDIRRPFARTAGAENDDAADDIARDPNRLIALLRQIGAGAAADGLPWPDGAPPPGRRFAMADADCALAGLRVVQEIMLAAERTRQNGDAEEYVGDRVMEGLMLACIGLCAYAGMQISPQ